MSSSSDGPPTSCDPERAGKTVVTISVVDRDVFVADLASRGISAGPIEAVGDAGRTANVVDADGNVIRWIQVGTRSEHRSRTHDPSPPPKETGAIPEVRSATVEDAR
jgi:hypothetical protein